MTIKSRQKRFKNSRKSRLKILSPHASSLVESGNWVDSDQSSGRIIHIPNGWSFIYAIANYTQGFNFISNEIPVLITFESNRQTAKEILRTIAARHSVIKSGHAAQQVRHAADKYLIDFKHLTPIVWTSVKDSGAMLTMCYLANRAAGAERLQISGRIF